jgi:hypothetical protein
MVAKLIRHKFQSAVADGTDATLVRPSVWNGDAHDFKLGGRTVVVLTDTIVNADEWSLIKYNRPGQNIAVSLAAPDANNFQAGWTTFLRNINSGIATITTPALIQFGMGSISSLNLRQGEDLILTSDGTNYDVLWSSGSLFARAGQIPGTATNDNAAAGNVGEFLFSVVPSGSGPGLVSSTAVAVAGVNLTPGDWDVQAMIGFVGGAATQVAYAIGSLSTAQGGITGGYGSVWQAYYNAGPFSSIGSIMLPISSVRYTPTSTTTVWLNAQVGFTPGSVSAFGTIRARRVR